MESRRQGDTVLVTTCLQTPKGELRRVFRKPEGQPGRYVEPFVKSDDDLQKYFSLPDEPSIPDLSTAKRVHDELGDRGLVYMSYEDPLYAVAQLFGFESLAMRCIQQFSLVKEMVDREFERIRAQLEHVLREGRGYDFLFHTAGPEIATPPLLPPHMFQQLVTPYHRELVSMIKAAGYHCAIHCHGKVGKVFDEFLDTGTDVLEPMEPPPQGDMTLEEALDKAEGRICLMGYIQDQDLYTCTPDEIREKVRAICGLVRGRPGYIMSTTATPYMFPPPERFVGNYVAFVEAAAS